MPQPVWVGIDVSGKWLDIGTHPQQQTMRFAYTDAGMMDLLAWLAARTVSGVAMEATGGIAGPSRHWGSYRCSKRQVCIADLVKSMPKSGIERAL
jgi:hypothetical protein